MATLKSLFWKHTLYRIFITNLLVSFQKIDANYLIKYEVTVNPPEFETTIHNKEVITTQLNASSITVLSDLPILRKGMLEITPETLHFRLTEHSLEKIEIGAFDNQNITETISLNSNKLTVIASTTFKNLKIRVLDLDYNEITHVEENAITDMPNLVQVLLSRNRIVKFHANSFVNTPNVWELDMQYNELGELGEKWFSFMKKEEALVILLGYNNIEKIHPKTFDGISIWTLALSHNKLNEVPGEIFTGNLVELMLNNNALEDLPDTFFQQRNLRRLSIGYNPLNCGTLQKLKMLAEGNILLTMYNNQYC
ncbi:asporin-like [Zophobas morio]|uniref:asporin-like n=1 Tax=Zophobas morio TaxID=2755281 RepID=UPI0030829154